MQKSAISQAALAYRAIEAQLVTLKLAPGQAITESELAQKLRLGRTPVREAVQRLAGEGLLLVFPRRGIVIPAVSGSEMLEALEIRTPLERIVATRAAQRASAAERAALDKAGGDMRAAAGKGDLEGYMAADKRIDDHLADAAKMPLAQAALQPLQSRARRFWYLHWRQDDLAAAARLHIAIVAGVHRADPERAGQASDALMAHLRAKLSAT